jgi:gas vesicle protein
MTQEREACSTYSAALGAFCLGALGGAVVGLLYAPLSGRETRERMSSGLRRTAESAQEMRQRLLRKGERALQEASRKTREAADALGSRMRRESTRNEDAAALES